VIATQVARLADAPGAAIDLASDALAGAAPL
jgi:hypothetical protein